jgi:hypothetical protein
VSVDRYDLVGEYDISVGKQTEGDYVLYDDYQLLESRVHELEAEKEGWNETAAQHLRNEDYYRGLVQEIGKHFGADAYISDDGSIQQDILCAKVPELVEQLRARHTAMVFKVQVAYGIALAILQGRADMSTIQDIERGLKAALAEVNHEPLKV